MSEYERWLLDGDVDVAVALLCRIGVCRAQVPEQVVLV